MVELPVVALRLDEYVYAYQQQVFPKILVASNSNREECFSVLITRIVGLSKGFWISGQSIGLYITQLIKKNLAIAKQIARQLQILTVATIWLSQLGESCRYVVAFAHFAGRGIWLRQESLRHILASPGYAPGKIAVNITWMERGFNACQTHRSMYPSIFNRFPSNP